MDKAVKVEKGYGKNPWTESTGTVETSIQVVAERAILFIDKSDQEETI